MKSLNRLQKWNLPLALSLACAVVLAGCITVLALWCQPNAFRSVLIIFKAQPLLILLNAMPVGLLLLIFAFAYILSFVEPNMASLKDGLWYCFAIVTTIGFGDFSAVTPIGRILSVILGLYGIIVVALITSIIVNFYGEMKSDDDED